MCSGTARRPRAAHAVVLFARPAGVVFAEGVRRRRHVGRGRSYRRVARHFARPRTIHERRQLPDTRRHVFLTMHKGLYAAHTITRSPTHTKLSSDRTRFSERVAAAAATVTG